MQTPVRKSGPGAAIRIVFGVETFSTRGFRQVLREWKRDGRRVGLARWNGHGEQSLDCTAIVESPGKDFDVGRAHGDALDGRFEHHFAYGDVFVHVRIDPMIRRDLLLFELDCPAGVNARENAPAEVDRLDDAAFGACDAMSAAIDPEASFEAGESF